MDISVAIKSVSKTDIFSLTQGSTLSKGGKKKSPDIWTACETVSDRYCCYYWKDKDRIRYVGSISADYTSPQHKTNLIGRISNYLQNHSGTTNKMVFEKVNQLLVCSEIHLGIFQFKKIMIDHVSYPYAVCVQNSAIIQMAEEILICKYRLIGEADWNRT